MDSDKIAVKRSRWSKEVAAAHIEAQQQSGLSKKDYSLREGIQYDRFNWWSRRLEPRTDKPPVTFVPVSIKSSSSSHATSLEVVTPGGYVIRVPDGFNQQTLKDTLSVMGSAC